VFADAGVDADGTAIIKGSARSIAGIHIRDMLDAVATHNPHLLNKFGGHAMAAGLTLQQKDFAAFAEAFESELQGMNDREVFKRVLLHDGDLPADCLTLEFAALLRYAAPWGQQFPEPVFTGEFVVSSVRVLSNRHLKLVLEIPGTGGLIDGIAFNVSPDLLNTDLNCLSLLYKLDVNEYRGNFSPQLMIEKLEIVQR